MPAWRRGRRSSRSRKRARLLPAVRERTRARPRRRSPASRCRPTRTPSAARQRMERAAGGILGGLGDGRRGAGDRGEGAVARRLRLGRRLLLLAWPEESLDVLPRLRDGLRGAGPDPVAPDQTIPSLRFPSGVIISALQGGSQTTATSASVTPGSARDLLLRVGGDRGPMPQPGAVSVIFTSTRLRPAGAAGSAGRRRGRGRRCSRGSRGRSRSGAGPRPPPRLTGPAAAASSARRRAGGREAERVGVPVPAIRKRPPSVGRLHGERAAERLRQDDGRAGGEDVTGSPLGMRMAWQSRVRVTVVLMRRHGGLSARVARTQSPGARRKGRGRRPRGRTPVSDGPSGPKRRYEVLAPERARRRGPATPSTGTSRGPRPARPPRSAGEIERRKGRGRDARSRAR